MLVSYAPSRQPWLRAIFEVPESLRHQALKLLHRRIAAGDQDISEVDPTFSRHHAKYSDQLSRYIRSHNIEAQRITSKSSPSAARVNSGPPSTLHARRAVKRKSDDLELVQSAVTGVVSAVNVLIKAVEKLVEEQPQANPTLTEFAQKRRRQERRSAGANGGLPAFRAPVRRSTSTSTDEDTIVVKVEP